ncbi:MAG: shikimate dehydrogenase [Thermoleophilaceae bacterium]|nr:shikimate dehydrogenase [Thermoleophilaceae bacterium]
MRTTVGPLAGVAGWPVAHSRSPAMQQAAFDALGLPWRYGFLPIPPELFTETVRALPASGYRGINVTIPHKLAAHELADEHSDAAAAIGAANTLTFIDTGAVAADNTDAGGLIDSLPGPVEGLRALVLGAGGAGRAAAWALREEAAEVSVWNRTPERARALAEDLRVRHAARPRDCDVLVNSTSVGLDPRLQESDALAALGLEGVAAPAVVVDLVYASGETPVQSWGLRAGAEVVDGLEVLVRQGARSFRLWTGEEPPLEAMRRAARA